MDLALFNIERSYCPARVSASTHLRLTLFVMRFTTKAIMLKHTRGCRDKKSLRHLQPRRPSLRHHSDIQGSGQDISRQYGGRNMAPCPHLSLDPPSQVTSGYASMYSRTFLRSTFPSVIVDKAPKKIWPTAEQKKTSGMINTAESKTSLSS